MDRGAPIGMETTYSAGPANEMRKCAERYAFETAHPRGGFFSAVEKAPNGQASANGKPYWASAVYPPKPRWKTPRRGIPRASPPVVTGSAAMLIFLTIKCSFDPSNTVDQSRKRMNHLGGLRKAARSAQRANGDSRHDTLGVRKTLICCCMGDLLKW